MQRTAVTRESADARRNVGITSDENLFSQGAAKSPKDRNVNGDSMSSTGIIARCNSLKTLKTLKTLKYMDLAWLGPCIFKFFKRTKPRHALDSRSAQDGPQTPKPPTKITKYRSRTSRIGDGCFRMFYNVLQLSPRKYSSVSSVSTRHCCLGGKCWESQDLKEDARICQTAWDAPASSAAAACHLRKLRVSLLLYQGSSTVLQMLKVGLLHSRLQPHHLWPSRE